MFTESRRKLSLEGDPGFTYCVERQEALALRLCPLEIIATEGQEQQLGLPQFDRVVGFQFGRGGNFSLIQFRLPRTFVRIAGHNTSAQNDAGVRMRVRPNLPRWSSPAR